MKSEPQIRLKYTEIKTYREKQLIAQQGLCLLCKTELDITEAVVDHNHKSGEIRGILHRGCNALLGHIENNTQRNQITNQKLTGITHNLMSYMTSTTGIIHPIHTKIRRKRVTNKKLKAIS